MRRILVATDFSTRSDRALRRATLLARQFAAELVFAHVVDDDQPARLVAAEERESQVLLEELAATVAATDGLACSFRIAHGEAFAGVQDIARQIEPGLIVIGPHRRQLLRDVFIGTTAERIIRDTRHPVLMVNAFATGPYRHLLLPVDLSAHSALAIQAARDLGLTAGVPATVMHAYDSLSDSLIVSSGATPERVKAAADRAAQDARRQVENFLVETGFSPAHVLVRPLHGFAAGTIATSAREQGADLVVLATRGCTGLTKIILGSVAEELLRVAEVDVLAIPPGWQRGAAPC